MNEAAERLRHLVITEAGSLRSEAVDKVIREALAVERRVTVERIRAGLALHPAPDGTYGKAFVQGILDEEAAR